MVLEHRTGNVFDAIVTGASAKGTWVRLRHLIIERRLEQGAGHAQVGERLRVRLLHVDSRRGFIDFPASVADAFGAVRRRSR